MLSVPMILSLCVVSQLCAQESGDWKTFYDGWQEDSSLEVDPEHRSDWGSTDDAWLRDNDVEPSSERTVDRRAALKALAKALFRLKHLKTQTSESVTKGKEVPEPTETSTESSLLVVPKTRPEESPPAPPSHRPHMMEDDKSHRFTHSIRFGYGEPHGPLL